MADVKRCDCCNDIYDPEELQYEYYLILKKIEYDPLQPDSCESKDVCPVCAKMISDFIKSLGKRGER